MKRVSCPGTMFLVAMAVHATAIAAPTPSPPRVFQAVLTPSVNEETLRQFLSSLPRDGPYYIVEGDLRLAESEIGPYLSTLRSPPKTINRSTELIVNRHNGAMDYWSDPSQRQLTYAVDRQSFASEEQYRQVVESVQRAGSDWEGLCPECGIRFVHRAEFDAAPSHEQVVFIVRSHLTPGYVALAFFPHDPPARRFLEIDPSFFTAPYDRVGILRHELGHVLGYRHEHAPGVPGCAREPDGQWVVLTPHDSKSVMHYPCGGATNPNFAFSRGENSDEAGHRDLYGPSHAGLSVREPEGGVLVVQFEGGEVADNMARVATVLNRRGWVELAEYEVPDLPRAAASPRGSNRSSKKTDPDSICKLYTQEAQFPTCSKEVIRLAGELNPDRSMSEHLKVRERVKYPKLKWERYEYDRRFDLSIERDRREIRTIRQNWKGNIVGDIDEGQGVVRVKLQGYRLEVPVSSVREAQRVREELAEIQGRNIVSYIRPNVPPAKTLYATRGVREHWRDCRNPTPTPGDQGSYLSLLGAPQLPECAQRCAQPPCPEVVVVDTPVAANPDLTAALGGDGVGGGAQPTPLGDRCVEVPFEPNKHHGTLLAAIVAAQDNDFGFVGVNPGARIAPFDWLHSDQGMLAQEIETRSTKSKQVFMFASQWPFKATEVDGTQLKEEDMRFRPLASKRIKELQPLWITAAGQWDRISDPNGRPIRLHKDTAIAPMNLGDLRNVIVVTACDDCEDGTARLMPDANYADGEQKLVHVAAPGLNIPGPVTDREYATASGTSQAVAFVAGIASSMLSCFPEYYAKPELVKIQLQVTARPVFKQPDADRVATGIVDPALALKDPRASYAKLAGKSLEPIEPERWCVPTIWLLDPSNRVPVDGWSVRTEDIYRIVQYRGAGGEQTAQWVIYKRRGYDPGRDHVGEVIRIGPGVWDGSDLLKVKGAMKAWRLENLEDLILAPSVRAGIC